MPKVCSFPNTQSFAIKSLFSFFSSLSETSYTNPLLFNYLIETLKIPKSQALVISNKYPYVKSLEKPQTVRQFFHNVGFSDTHIQLSVIRAPRILLSDVDKTLKPKIDFFRHLGLVGSDLGKFISKDPSVLHVSLEKKLIPCVEIIKEILVDDSNNENLIRVTSRCRRLLRIDPEKSGLLRNIEYFKRCGIVGSQLSVFLVKQPRLFYLEESKLRDLVLRVLNMGFSINSRMFVYGLYALSCVSEEAFYRKLELFRSYGFSAEEFTEMFRKTPGILRMSKEKLKLGLEFFLKNIEFENAVLVRTPVCLTYSIENRVIPRYRVFQILMSKRLVKKERTFINSTLCSEENFLKRYVLRFGDDAEELLLAYKGHKLGSSSEDES